MSTKNIQARWIVDDSQPKQLAVIEDTEDGIGICEMYPGDSLANARLIAASPELLVALKEMLEEWNRHGCCDSRGVYNKAERIVAKAEGRV